MAIGGSKFESLCEPKKKKKTFTYQKKCCSKSYLMNIPYHASLQHSICYRAVDKYNKWAALEETRWRQKSWGIMAMRRRISGWVGVVGVGI